MRGNSRALLLPALASAALALVPFARPLLQGECFFFRDIARTFFPIKRFAADGLRAGEVRFWNPLLHEGVPLHLGPLSYPIDLLHGLWVDERFFTLLLALHVPLAAAGFAALAQRLGCAGPAAAGGAVVYALGGFSLSCVSFYVYTQALAWAPLVVLGLMRAAEAGGRWLALAPLPVFLCATTGGVEVFGQSALMGLVFAVGRGAPARRLVRASAALVLGLGLAAPALLVSWTQLGGSARAAGLPTAVVLAHSVDPWTLPQLLIGNWHGNLLDVANQWWGANFFPLGFPYFLSLYLGAAALALAGVGALSRAPGAGRATALGVIALLVCLGRFAGLEPLVEALPSLRLLRFPVKAFFSVHACAALLVAFGLQTLGSEPRAWRRLLALAGGLGGILVALPGLPVAAKAVWSWFLGGFMPPEHGLALRVRNGELLLGDAARGGLVALSLALVAAMTLRGRLRPGRGAAMAVALLAADLLRAGAGLNPSVSASFYRLSPETESAIAPVRASGTRVFSCDPESSPGYFAARSGLPSHDVWSFAVAMETLTPNLNVAFGVKTALSRDLTMMVPESRVLAPEETSPQAVPRLLERLRAAGVTRVLCVDPIGVEGLRELPTLRPGRIAPLALHVYEVAGALPMRAVEGGRGHIVAASESANRLRFEVVAESPAMLVVRDALAPGWSARLDGAPAPLHAVEGHYRGVAVGPGRSRVSLDYRPGGFVAGLVLACLSLSVIVVLTVRSVWGRP